MTMWETCQTRRLTKILISHFITLLLAVNGLSDVEKKVNITDNTSMMQAYCVYVLHETNPTFIVILCNGDTCDGKTPKAQIIFQLFFFFLWRASGEGGRNISF